MARPIDRKRTLEIIQKKFEGMGQPLVSFPPKLGFPNVVYLYHKDANELIDYVAQLTASTSVALNTPVMLFIEPLYRAPQMAATCDRWLKVL